MDQTTSLGGLFITAFLSSTLLPGGSEWAIVWLNHQGTTPAWALLAVASGGNTLGGLTTWLLGRLAATRYGSEKLPKPAQRRAAARLLRWGSPALLLSWVPIVGDPLCFVAGWLRIGLAPATLYIFCGKTARYAGLLWLSGGI